MENTNAVKVARWCTFFHQLFLRSGRGAELPGADPGWEKSFKIPDNTSTNKCLSFLSFFFCLLARTDGYKSNKHSHTQGSFSCCFGFQRIHCFLLLLLLLLESHLILCVGHKHRKRSNRLWFTKQLTRWVAVHKLTSSISFDCFLGAFRGFFLPPVWANT